MGGAAVDVAGAEPLQRRHRLRHGPRRVDHVVGDQTVAVAHLADDVQDLGHVGRGPPLVDDRQRRVEPLGEPARHLGGADVGRHDHRIVQLLLPVVAHQHRRRVQVIDREVEEPLQLVLVKVHRQHPVRARHRDHVGHQLGADGHPRLVLPVLPGIPEVRHDGGDPGRAGPPGGVHEEQQLHHVLGGRVGRLDDVDVPAAHVLVDLDEQLTVGEAPERDLAEGLPQMGGHLFGEGAVGRAAQEQHLAARQREIRHNYSPQT